jgi:hypothetical protein
MAWWGFPATQFQLFPVAIIQSDWWRPNDHPKKTEQVIIIVRRLFRDFPNVSQFWARFYSGISH